jgi:hypothetical protein
MAGRKWVVRGVVFLVVSGTALAGLAIQRFTNSAAVRQQVLDKLSEYLPGAKVSLESARFALLEGITFNDLRLARKDDPRKADFAYFPTGTIYHDKQQLLRHGKLVISKVVFSRPRFHALRRPDGTWNLQNILAAPDLHVPVPTLVFQQATLVIEDQQVSSGRPPLEIKDVDLTIINDPHRPPEVSVLAFQGVGVNDLAGSVRVSGSWGRRADDLVLSVQLPSFAVDGALVERLSAYCVETGRHARQLTGRGKLQADFRYQPDAVKKWSYEIHAELAQGKLIHALLPFPLDSLEAKATCTDGLVTLQKLTARAGATRLTLTDTAFAPSDDPDVAGVVEIEHLALNGELFARLPKLQEIQKDYQPSGSLNVRVEFRKQGPNWRHHCVVRPENASAVCSKFPYPMERITGEIEHESDAIHPDRPDRLELNLVGYSGSQAVHLQGTVLGKGPAASLKLEIWGKDLPIDQKLRGALEPAFQRIVDSFSPSGLVDIEAHIRKAPGETKPHNQYLARFHQASIRYDIFRYPVENVTGTLDIQSNHWEFRDFHGTHKGGEFYSHGGSDPNTKKVTIDVTGTNVLLDEEMESALVRQPGLQNTWRKLNPTGRLSFEAHVEQPSGQAEPDIAVMLRPLACSLRPEFFRYALEEMQGLIVYRNGEAILEKLSARHGPTELSLERGKIRLMAGGAVSVDLVNFLGLPIVVDAELLQALPKSLGEACASLRLKAPLSLRTNMTIYVPADQSPPYIYWDGALRLKKASVTAGVQMEQVSGTIGCWGEHQGKFGNVVGELVLDQAVVLNQTFQDIHSQLVIRAEKPDVLDLPNFKTRIYGGEISGPIHIDFGPNLRYALDLTASQIKLEQFARHNNLGPNARLKGQASARLYLEGQGTETSGMQGRGTLDVPQGQMYNLPLLLDLLKVLSLRLPDKTAFEEARMQFAIHGPRVDITDLNLYGNSISLSGQGSMSLYGTDIKLDFYAVWGRIVQFSPPGIGKIWPAISRQVLKIKLRGELGKVEATKEPVPIIVEPVMKLLKRMSGK